jgi:hypothetical protein
MKRFRKPLAVMLVGTAAAITITFAAAPAQAAPRNTQATTQVEQTEGPVQTLSLGDCTSVLADFGYDRTVPRILACTAAAIHTPTGYASCLIGLRASGVYSTVSVLACTAALV